MATGGELNGGEGSKANPAPDGRISGLGKIIYIAENCGLLYSTNKQRIYFGEKQFHPFVKGVFGTLEKGIYLHFEARQSRKGGTKLTYSATKVWRPDVKESSESALSKKKHDGSVAMEAINFLRSILDVHLPFSLSNIHPLLSEAPRNVQDLLSSGKDVKKLLRRFPSVFQYSAAPDAVSLVDGTVHGAIDCVVDLFKDDSCVDLGLLYEGVAAAPGAEIRQHLGHSEADLLKFLKHYRDVFQVSKKDKDGRFSVSLRLSSAAAAAAAAAEADDSYDTQSVESFRSQDACSSSSGGSSGVRSLSSAFSVSPLNASSKLHESGTGLSPDGTAKSGTGLSPDGTAKQRGIAKLLNALADREPMSLGSLIGYIHSSPPDIRDAIGNKMNRFTEFIKTDNNFFLLEPHNLVFVRNSVEKKALEYLVSIVAKYMIVTLADLLSLLKSDSDAAPAEVGALFGNDVSEISASVGKLLARQELVPCSSLVLQNDLISIKASSRQFNPKSIVNDSASTVVVVGDEVPETAYSAPSEEDVSFSSAFESEAVEFLRSIAQRHKPLAVSNVKSHLGQVSAEIRQVLGSEALIRDLVKRHPSVFKSLVAEDVVRLVDDNVRGAVEFFSGVLTSKGDLLISSLVGHQSSASASVRSATGGNPASVTEFLKRHFDTFRSYEGEKGPTVGLVRRNSQQRLTFNPNPNPVQCPAPVADDSTGSVDQEGVPGRADGDTGSSDETELDFLVDLLKDRGAVCLKDVARCVSDAPMEIQDTIGHGDDKVLSYIEENPAVFKVSQGGRHVELVSEDEGDAIEFFLDVLNRRGATPVSKIHGHLSQAGESVRRATGGSPESVASFLLGFPNVFRTLRNKDVEMIESLYEGKGDAGAVTLDETASRSDKIDSDDSIVGLTVLKSNAAVLSGTTLLNPAVVSSPLVSDAIEERESELHGAQFLEDGTKSNGICRRGEPSFAEGDCYGHHSQKPISDACVAFDRIDHHLNDGKTVSDSGRELFENFREEKVAEETLLGVDVAPGATLSKDVQSGEILSVMDLVRSAEDEQNLVADLCYETFSRRGGGGGGSSLRTAELLSICRLADPLHKKWQRTLSLGRLNRILAADDRFVADKANGGVFLRMDVERMAVRFLQHCIRLNGPIKMTNMKRYDYLKTAGPAVRAVLSKGEDSGRFKQSLVSALWPKYRDQLNKEDGCLVIPFDDETLAIAFLSRLIETLGPIHVDVFFQHLPNAPPEVRRFYEEKRRMDVKLYLSSLSLGKHFIVVEDTVDLVRSGNLDKNRLVVEQQAVSFLVGVIRAHGPMLLGGKKVGYLKTAAPAVRKLLGKEWNACVCKNKPLKRLCLRRPEVFVVGKKTISLVDSAVHEAAFCDVSTSDGGGVWDSQSARDMALEFLLGVMRNGGTLSLRLRELGKPDLFSAPPQVRILLGGEVSSVQLKKNLVVTFCSSFPEIFTVYRKSVSLKGTTSGSMGTPVAPGSLGHSGSNNVAPPAKGVTPLGQETTHDVQHVACLSVVPTCVTSQPAACLPAVTPETNGSEDPDQSSDENSNENSETSELNDFHCGQLLTDDSNALLEKSVNKACDEHHRRPDSLSTTLSSVSQSTASYALASSQKSSVPVNWSSMAMRSHVLNFREEFNPPLGEDLCQYVDHLDTDALKNGSLTTTNDEWHSSDAEQERSVNVDDDADAVVKGNGTVLSAEGNLLYVKCEDGRLISCSSKICSGRFNGCQNIGRHFAVGEKVDVISERPTGRLAVRRSSSPGGSEEAVSSAGCCSEARIESGRGRVSVLSGDVIAVMMGSLEMAAFRGTTRHLCSRLVLDDVVSFSARRVRGFMAPWQLDDVRTDRHDDGTGQDFFRLNSTSDFGCQASTMNGDVIKVGERDPVGDDVIASGSP